MTTNAAIDSSSALTAALSHYVEPAPGARDRVARCLHVILTAYLAGRLKQEAEALLAALA